MYVYHIMFKENIFHDRKTTTIATIRQDRPKRDRCGQLSSSTDRLPLYIVEFLCLYDEINLVVVENTAMACSEGSTADPLTFEK